MVMMAMVGVSADLDLRQLAGARGLLIVYELFNGPAETSCIVGVNGFENEQDGAKFEEDNSANESRHASTVVDLPREFCGRGHDGKPDEKALQRSVSGHFPFGYA